MSGAEVAIALAIASAAGGAYSANEQAKAQADQQKTSATIAKLNAEADHDAAMANAQQASSNIQISQINARNQLEQQRRQVRRQKGAIEAVGAGSGLELSTDDVMRDMFAESERDSLNIKHSAFVEQSGLEYGRGLDLASATYAKSGGEFAYKSGMAAAKGTRRAGRIAAGTELLKGGSTVYGLGKDAGYWGT